MSTIQNDRNYCSTCKKQLSTGSAYSNHIKSKKHSLKLLESQPFNETKQILGNSNYVNANITNSFDYINSEYDNEEYYSKEHDGEEYNNEELIEDCESYDFSDSLTQVVSSVEETHETISPPQMITNLFSNNIAEEYAKLIIKHNLSQNAADDIRRFFNKFSLWSKSPLPNSAKQTHQIIDQIETKNIKFEKKLITSLNGIDYFLEYRTIFAAIAELLENELIA
ncbi:6224_t:CDS:2, partial [Entrophospora sp. SA101]